ncbi:MAG: hypothetical protein ACI82F_002480, partial [Planctomycetota bacterium]
MSPTRARVLLNSAPLWPRIGLHRMARIDTFFKRMIEVEASDL